MTGTQDTARRRADTGLTPAQGTLRKLKQVEHQDIHQQYYFAYKSLIKKRMKMFWDSTINFGKIEKSKNSWPV